MWFIVVIISTTVVFAVIGFVVDIKKIVSVGELQFIGVLSSSK